MLTRAARTSGPDRVDLLDDAESNLADAAAELRRIVDDRRPPALDRGPRAAVDVVPRRRDNAPPYLLHAI
jgi:signal transduction histidine kinase